MFCHLAFSIMLIVSGVAPAFMEWSRIPASSLDGFDNGLELLKRSFSVLLTVGALLAILFEVILGEWLSVYPC
jgi:hypothetical protein